MSKRTSEKTSPKLRDDIFYVCTVIERTARKIKHRNKYVVNKLGKEELTHLLQYADVYHSENQDEICDNLIQEYKLRKGNFDILEVDTNLCKEPPSVNDISKVYERLIWMTSYQGELISHAIKRVYNNKICNLIDDYNGCAYYASSLALEQTYRTGVFD